ncbi:hypothetical protein N7495_001905 [Penicillium taxi]|uniref:uncharacterized protein n=1 Tax=Penicillium taxi TaxID=168475 RepID=UPI002545AA9D|nr:uncharacterized protein N7495_001905 [Penicillium taxi]KAJ5909223.1 hypothetical protein N7495_001905 [Penicillium taxi]
MAIGGCFCGNIRVESTAEPIASGVCHCYDCRKLTGCLSTINFIFKTTDLKITGTPKGVSKTADSGNHLKNFFCPDCGTPLYGGSVNSSGTLAETIVVRAGIFDDLEELDARKPQLEIFTNGRVKWVEPIEGAAQFTKSPPSYSTPTEIP